MQRSPGGLVRQLKELIGRAAPRPASLGSDLMGRVKKGLAAQAFANAVRIVVQIASVPLFLAYWGVTLYGEWLLLTALLTYLQLSDAGFTTAAGNDMAMRVGAGEREVALRVFQSTSLLLLLCSAAVFAAAAAAVYAAIPIRSFLSIELLSPRDTGLVVLLLAGTIIVHQQGEMVQAGFRCQGRYGLGTFLAGSGELLVFTTIVAVVTVGGSPLHVAAAQLVGYTLRAAVLYLFLRRVCPWIRFGFRHANSATAKRLVRPSLSFMAFPIGNTLIMQGTLIAIGWALNPAAVVTFNTLRTLARYALQPSQMLNSVIGPEISLAYGRHDYGLLRTVYRRACQVGFWAAAACATVLILFGEHVVLIWTNGAVELHWSIFLPMLLASVLHSSTFASGAVLYATNNHLQPSVAYLIFSSATLAGSVLVAERHGLPGVAVVTLVCEILFIIYIVKKALSFLGERTGIPWIPG